MPIYEYACQECGKQFEYMQSVSEDPKTECEACGGDLKKLISATSFQLKGSGWYKDLYSSAKPSSESKTESKSEGKSEGKSEKKSEKKSEVKPSKGDSK